MNPAAEPDPGYTPPLGHAPHPPRHRSATNGLVAAGVGAALVSLTATTIISTGLVVGGPAAATAGAAIVLALTAVLCGLSASGRVTIRPPRLHRPRTPPGTMTTTVIVLGALASFLAILLVMAALLLGSTLRFYPFASLADRAYQICLGHAATADQAQDCAELIAGPG